MLLLVSIGCLVAAIALMAWSRRRKLAAAVNALPMLKMRFYHVFGHAHGFLYLRTLKLKWPHHVYDFQVINGYSFLFRKHSIAAIWASFFPVIHFHRADSVQAILNHSTELKKGFTYKFLHPWLGDGLLISDGSKWKTRRKLLTPAFHFNILKDFVAVFAKQAKVLTDLLAHHTEDECVDIVPFITKCSFDIMCESMLGVETHAQTNPSCSYLNSVKVLTDTSFERMVNPLLWSEFLFKLSPLGRKFFEHAQRAQQFTYKIISERKRDRQLRSGGEDRRRRALLDLLIEDHVTGQSDLTEDDIREEIDTFTFEGHDTTAMAMSWALYLVGLHRNVQEKIHQELDSLFGEDTEREANSDDLREMKYLECVLKESLRLYPSVPYFGRYIQQDLEIEGMTVPKGSTCMVVSYFLHRNPEEWPNPEKFDPERFAPENSVGRHPFAYIPFSAGPRNCIGQRFALLEEKVVLSTILRKYQLLSLDPRDQVQLMNEIILKPVNGLRLQIRPRGYRLEKSSAFNYYP